MSVNWQSLTKANWEKYLWIGMNSKQFSNHLQYCYCCCCCWCLLIIYTSHRYRHSSASFITFIIIMFLLHILCVLDLKCIELLSTCVDVIHNDEAVALINTLTPTDNEQHLRFFHSHLLAVFLLLHAQQVQTYAAWLTALFCSIYIVRDDKNAIRADDLCISLLTQMHFWYYFFSCIICGMVATLHLKFSGLLCRHRRNVYTQCVWNMAIIKRDF